jgi:hypothetical protein
MLLSYVIFFVFIPCFYLTLSPSDAVSCYHAILYHYVINSCKTNVIMQSYHPMLSLSPLVIIPCYHTMLSCHVIMPCYSMLYHVISLWNNPMFPSDVITPCNNSTLSAAMFLSLCYHSILPSDVIMRLYSIIRCHHPMTSSQANLFRKTYCSATIWEIGGTLWKVKKKSFIF